MLVGQPAKNLLNSRNARSVVGHELLLGMQYDSPEATALRTPDTALRTPGTQSVRLPCRAVRDHEIMGARDRAIPVLGKILRQHVHLATLSTTKNNRSATVCRSHVWYTHA